MTPGSSAPITGKTIPTRSYLILSAVIKNSAGRTRCEIPKVYPHIYLTDPISLHGIHPAVPGGNRKTGFCQIIPAVWSSGPADSGESVLLAYAASDPKARQ